MVRVVARRRNNNAARRWRVAQLYNVGRAMYDSYNRNYRSGLAQWNRDARAYDEAHYGSPAFPSAGMRHFYYPKGAPEFKATYGGPAWLSKPIKGKIFKPSSIPYKGIILRQEASVTATASRKVWFGHYTHPHKSVVTGICYALSKQLGWLMAKHKPTSLQESFGGNIGLCNIDINIRFRTHTDENDTFSNASTSTSINVTYIGFAVLLRDLFYSMFSDTADTQFLTLDTITCTCQDQTTIGFNTKVSPVCIRFSDMLVTVDGMSLLKYQNVTLSDSAGSDDRANIEANPLEGFEYEYRGSRNMLKHATTGSAQLSTVVDSVIGYNNFDSTAHPDATVDTIVGNYPTGRDFQFYATTRVVNMQPGVLSKSVLRKVHTMPFVRWLNSYARALKSTYANDTGPSERTKLGRSRYYCVDKMIHDSGDGQTLVNLECENILKVVVKLKPSKIATAAYNSLT